MLFDAEISASTWG